MHPYSFCLRAAGGCNFLRLLDFHSQFFHLILILLQTVQKVRRQINPKLKIEGILLTMTDNRTNYGQQIDNLIRGAYGSKIKVFDQTIPRSVRAAEISAVGKSIFQHDPKGKVAEAYQSLTKTNY